MCRMMFRHRSGWTMEHLILIKPTTMEENLLYLENIIQNVSSLIDWVDRNTQSSKRLTMSKQLVDCRRRLKRIKNAMEDNPTIAAFGESQQGKSYIISSLLSSPGKSLMIRDGDGSRIDFISRINMRTDNQESTGVVTRFTTSRFVEDPHFPVKLHLLSAADFVIILTDSYMKDITGYQPYGEKDLRGIADRLVEKYSEKGFIQDYLTEDEIGDIEEYIKTYDTVTSAVYINSGYFDVLSTIIRKVPVEEWKEVFAPLWREDETLGKFFSLYLNVYHSMEFSRDVFIPMQAVLNDFNDGSPTLMGVRALDGLKDFVMNGLNVGTQTEVLLPSGNRLHVNKSLLSAMTAEAVYYVDDEVLEEEVKFDFRGIRSSETRTAEENVQMLKDVHIGEPFQKNFLRGIDFLDFPGARGRDLRFLPSQILDQFVMLLLRCKVAYLFNKYSEDLKLSILMFCHSHKNTTPNLVAPILKTWVETYIGGTARDRRDYLANYQVPPLFLISTMYNMDLVIRKDIDNRIWDRRLNTILYDEVIIGKTNKWFDEWIPGKNFDNTFLLRDYFYSSDANEGGKIFSGYPDPEQEEFQIEERARLKNIFLKDSGVKRFFSNPELTWDVSSTIGNDGSYYMLKRLSAASECVVRARDVKFKEKIKEIAAKVYDVVKGEYHGGEDAELLRQNISSARRFYFALSRACESRSDFFGRMIQFLQMNTNFVASFFAKIIHSGLMIDPAEAQDYDLIVKGVEEAGYQFDPSPGEAAYNNNMQILADVYGINGPDDPMLKGVDLETLFHSTYKRQCTPSLVLSTKLLEYWKDNLQKPENSVNFLQVGFDSIAFSNFITNFINMMKKVNLSGEMARAIKDYVDYTPTIAPENEELIADIAANVYNTFVMNMGYDFLDDSQKENHLNLCRRYKLPEVIDKNDNGNEAVTDETMLESLFSQLEQLNEGEGGQLTRLPSYTRMRAWVSYVFMSFTIAYDVVNYDENANSLLGEILKKIETEAASLI